MDLHRRRSVLVRMGETGEHLETVRILNDRDSLAVVMSRAGESPEVVLEATYGWYWAVDALAELGATVHLAHPLGVKGFSYRRVKNDLLTELSASSRRGCVRRRARLARFAAREQRCGFAAGVVRTGGAAAGFAGGDRRAVRAVSAG
jgi:transposase